AIVTVLQHAELTGRGVLARPLARDGRVAPYGEPKPRPRPKERHPGPGREREAERVRLYPSARRNPSSERNRRAAPRHPPAPDADLAEPAPRPPAGPAEDVGPEVEPRITTRLRSDPAADPPLSLEQDDVEIA